MTNIIYEDKLYNETVKREFMSKYGEKTQNILNRMFKISCALEEDLEKDLYQFNREELKRLFFAFTPRTENASKANVNWVSTYINWAIEEGYLNGLNPIDYVDADWKTQFANKKIKNLWTVEEMEKIYSKIVNAQDRVIPCLLFNGVCGEENAEIVNLKISDVDDKNNSLRLTDNDGSERIIEVDEYCIETCKKAFYENDYKKSNGNPDPDTKADVAQLIENQYVVRSVNSRTTHYEQADKNVVYRRLATISEAIGEPYFNPSNIRNSGMLALANRLYKETGKLDKKEYEVIREKFNVSVQSLTRIKNEFLNLKTLKEVYQLS